jgi:hypothetical protein
VLVHRLNTDRLVHLWMLKAMCGAKLTAWTTSIFLQWHHGTCKWLNKLCCKIRWLYSEIMKVPYMYYSSEWLAADTVIYLTLQHCVGLPSSSNGVNLVEET